MGRTTIATGPRGVRKGAILNRIRLFFDVWSERRALDRLDSRMLADIGLDCTQARAEAARTPWDVPTGRLNDGERYRLWQGF
jgi:uncharacterized protein YjiS (DUF1127 family)